jgi:hypothetical protein
MARQSEQAPRNSVDDEKFTEVKIKEIQVKQLDRNITHLRAAKQLQSSIAGTSVMSHDFGSPGLLSNHSRILCEQVHWHCT